MWEHKFNLWLQFKVHYYPFGTSVAVAFLCISIIWVTVWNPQLFSGLQHFIQKKFTNNSLFMDFFTKVFYIQMHQNKISWIASWLFSKLWVRPAALYVAGFGFTYTISNWNFQCKNIFQKKVHFSNSFLLFLIPR